MVPSGLGFSASQPGGVAWGPDLGLADPCTGTLPHSCWQGRLHPDTKIDKKNFKISLSDLKSA